MPGYRWQITTPHGEFRFEVARVGGRSPSREERLRAQHAWFFAQHELHSLSPVAIEAALELCSELGMARDWRTFRSIDRSSAQFLAQELELALLSGRLFLAEIPRIHAWGAGPKARASSESQKPPPFDPPPSPPPRRFQPLDSPPPSPEPQPPSSPPPESVSPAETTFIELLLVDSEEKPLPGAPYRITLPDGSVRRGLLDQNGFVRLEGIDPGECRVEFPDLHQWPRG